MKYLPKENIIQAEGIRMRLAEISDAEFIVNIRTNSKLDRYISHTSSSIEDQINWIKEYKKRELEQKEFYFIFEDSNYKPWGTMSLYDLTKDSFTQGSWLCLPGNKDNIALKADLLGKEFAFEKLNYNACLFDTRKKNRRVLALNKLFCPVLIDEDDLSFFFRLDKETYYKNREKVIKLFDLRF